MCGKKEHVQHVESGNMDKVFWTQTHHVNVNFIVCMYVVHVLACVPSSKKRRLHTITRTIHVTIHNQQ